MFFSLTTRYKQLPTLSEKHDPYRPSPVSWANLFAWGGWMLAAIFASSTAFLACRLNTLSPSTTSQHGDYQTGFATEFNSVKPHLQEKPQMFWGGPRWHDNGSFYKLEDPSKPTYVGPPSDAIDAAWDELLHGRYFEITEEEAVATFGPHHNVHFHWNVGYLMGLDVFHTLHCVDQLRKMLDRDYYFQHKVFPERGHQDHCLDHIRQQLMCSADMTPIPVIWYEGHGRSFVQSDVVHTCRNWDAIQSWVGERKEQSERWAIERVEKVRLEQAAEEEKSHQDGQP